jgi:hypothetical protein
MSDERESVNAVKMSLRAHSLKVVVPQTRYQYPHNLTSSISGNEGRLLTIDCLFIPIIVGVVGKRNSGDWYPRNLQNSWRAWRKVSTKQVVAE